MDLKEKAKARQKRANRKELDEAYRKGIPEDVAQATVDSYIKNNQLKERALKVYNEQEAIDKQRLAQMEEYSQIGRAHV